MIKDEEGFMGYLGCLAYLVLFFIGAMVLGLVIKGTFYIWDLIL